MMMQRADAADDNAQLDTQHDRSTPGGIEGRLAGTSAVALASQQANTNQRHIVLHLGDMICASCMLQDCPVIIYPVTCACTFQFE